MTEQKPNHEDADEESTAAETSNEHPETQPSAPAPNPAEPDAESGAGPSDVTGESDSKSGSSANDTAAKQEDDTGSDGGETVVAMRRPTLRPTLLRLGLTLLVGGLLLVPLIGVEELLGSDALTQLGAVIVGLLLIVAVGRLLIELLVLRRTKYLITERGIKQRYSLLGYTKTREVPYGLVRSTELEQKRLQYLFGVSTISLNQGLGDLRLPAVSDYEAFYDEIRDRVERTVTGEETSSV